MNDEKKYTVIMPFIGHPSITFKKSLAKNLKSINKKVTISKTFKVQNYFSLKDETPLALQENIVYLFEGSCDKNQTYIGKTKDIWQLGLGSIFQEIQPFFNIDLPAKHVIILPLRIFIFCHMVAMILVTK